MTPWQHLTRNIAVWWCRRFHRKHHTRQYISHTGHMVTCNKCWLTYPIY
jgi:hypothetical protein